MEVSVLIAMAGVLGAGVASWVGVKVGQAENRRDILHINKAMEASEKDLNKRLDQIERKIDRLEDPYFRQK